MDEPTEQSGRTDEIVRLLAAEPLDDNWSNAFAMLLTDAQLTRDLPALVTAGERLYLRLDSLDESAHLERGRLLSYLDLVRWSQRRTLPSYQASAVERDSASHRFLWLVSTHPGLTSSELQRRGVGREESVSRVGRRLREVGLVVQTRAGRSKQWELTPRGERIVDELGTPAAVDHSRELAPLIDATWRLRRASSIARSRAMTHEDSPDIELPQFFVGSDVFTNVWDSDNREPVPQQYTG